MEGGVVASVFIFMMFGSAPNCEWMMPVCHYTPY